MGKGIAALNIVLLLVLVGVVAAVLYYTLTPGLLQHAEAGTFTLHHLLVVEEVTTRKWLGITEVKAYVRSVGGADARVEGIYILDRDGNPVWAKDYHSARALHVKSGGSPRENYVYHYETLATPTTRILVHVRARILNVEWGPSSYFAVLRLDVESSSGETLSASICYRADGSVLVEKPSGTIPYAKVAEIGPGWHTMAIIVDTSTGRLSYYLDGEPVASYTITISNVASYKLYLATLPDKLLIGLPQGGGPPGPLTPASSVEALYDDVFACYKTGGGQAYCSYESFDDNSYTDYLDVEGNPTLKLVPEESKCPVGSICIYTLYVPSLNTGTYTLKVYEQGASSQKEFRAY